MPKYNMKPQTTNVAKQKTTTIILKLTFIILNLFTSSDTEENVSCC